jgi:hypothetical protein
MGRIDRMQKNRSLLDQHRRGLMTLESKASTRCLMSISTLLKCCSMAAMIPSGRSSNEYS